MRIMQAETELWSLVVFDIDGVIRDVSGSYRRALADTVEAYTQGAYRPTTADIDQLKSEGVWNNDWEASQEMVYRYFEAQGKARSQLDLDYAAMVDFFQSRYRGQDPNNPDQWNGYICSEPLLTESQYFQHLTQAGIGWGFFSGATRGSASYILEKRLGLQSPILVAMDDAPGKPDPTGLMDTVQQIQASWQNAQLPNFTSQPESQFSNLPVLYLGDTVADMQTVKNAQQAYPDRTWIGVGILPPHAQAEADYAERYTQQLKAAGAMVVFKNVQDCDRGQVKACLQAVNV